MEVIFGFLILIYASFLDLKYREIDDKSWMSLVVLGFLFLAINYAGEGTEVLLPFAFSVLFTLALVAILYYLGMMGSGDCKIILGISVLLPTPVHFSIFPIFSLGMFTNAIILSTTVPIFFFIYNIRHLLDVRNLKDFLVLFLGYKRVGTDIRPFEVALETEDGIRIFLNTKDLELGKKLSTDRLVWVSPAIPFVVFITIGYMVSVIFGDFISYASLIWGVI